MVENNTSKAVHAQYQSANDTMYEEKAPSILLNLVP